MWEKLFDFFVDTMTLFFFPMVCMYHTLTSDLFFNVAVEDAPALENLSNTLLVPLQYLCDGKSAVQQSDGSWELVQRFDYSGAYWPKTVASVVALPVSVPLGSLVKAASFCNHKTRAAHTALKKAQYAQEVVSNERAYEEIGLDLWACGTIKHQGHKRRPGDEKRLEAMVQCLAQIASAFNKAKIPWWVHCGTCLGVYRYGGVIPWDNDLDIAILATDFENARRALNRLDRSKYLIQDWSSRDFPNSWFKIYIRETKQLLDIYCYAVDPVHQEISYIFSFENNIFFPGWWKEREKSFKTPTPFAHVFPLKRAEFDGLEVFVPCEIEKFLQRYYGENLAPARLYDENTCRYEKDLSHPYWQLPCAH